ncbi:gliding motility-associated C-terminal domain-containing protein [Phnomibacter ginsenosidimutans]|uniref:T9SS type B sorting domain-containing protein n=1 Tax=Phnomibacter ginsenosidimutans TaxID=2676868 RepID=UPI0018D25383|nr:gliding motility-associated C-terminal domain-containing protein [Phnomibacter ginsenosidimutans]
MNAPIYIQNSSPAGQAYYWNFCAGDLNQIPTAQNYSVAPESNTPVFMDYANDNGEWIGLVVNHLSGTISRLRYGNSLNNNPSITNLGSLGVMPLYLEGIQIVHDGQQWFAFVVGGQRSQSALIKLNFGNSLLNTPTAVNYGAIGGIDFPVDISIFNKNGKWYAFTVSAYNNSLTRYDFGDNLDNMPTGINFGNLGNLRYPTGIFGIEENSDYYLYVVSQDDNRIIRLNFGNDITSVPSAKDLALVNGTLNAPRDITLIRDCGNNFGFVVNANSSSLMKLDFGNSLLNDAPVATDLGNNGNMNFPHSISTIFRTGNQLNFFVTNVRNNSFTVFTFANCSSTNIPSSSAFNPPVYTYSQPGKYNITLHMNEGQASQSVFCKTIVVMEAPLLNLGDTLNQCSGETLAIGKQFTDASHYRWSTGETSAFIQPSQPGWYWLEVTFRSGCYTRDSVFVRQPQGATFDFGPDKNICQSGPFTLDGPPGMLRYEWNDGSTTQSINTSIGGTFYLTVTDSCGKQYSDTIRINRTLNTSPLSLGNDTTVCVNKWPMSVPNQYARYLWSNGDTTNFTSSTASGTYWLTAWDICDQAMSDTINITQHAPAYTNLGNDTLYCGNFSQTLHANMQMPSFTWSTNENSSSITITQPGIYWAEVKDLCNNTYRDSITIRQMPKASPFSLGNDIRSCGDSSFTLTGPSNAATYVWSNNSQNISTRITSPGDYWLTISDACGNSFADSINYSRLQVPNVFLGDDTVLCIKNSFPLSAGNDGASYLWSTGSTTQKIDISQSGTYWVKVVNDVGCVAADTVNLKISMSQNMGLFQMPTAFTPNNDGLNDCFGIGKWGDVKVYKFEIYNRWGELIFTTTKASDCWNGKRNGTAQPSGQYAYIVVAETACGIVEHKGLFSLIR